MVKAKGNKYFQIFCCWLILLLTAGCANRVIPGGGEIDKEPPQLVKSYPENNTINFNGNTIEIEFDEYVQVSEKDIKMAISPPIIPAPKAIAKRKSIVVELGDSLKPATTYTIDFGDVIKDVTEGNAVSGFRFVFATGDQIDSLSIPGTIEDALTGKPVADALAVAFPAAVPDSLIPVTLPEYYARAGTAGNFVIANMRPGQYRLFAVDDKNGNLKADPDQERIAFLGETVPAGTSKVKLKASKQILSKQQLQSATLNEPGRATFIFARPVEQLKLDWLMPEPDTILTKYSLSGDTLMLVYYPPADSLHLIISDQMMERDTVSKQLIKGSDPVLNATQFMQWKSLPVNGGKMVPGDPMVIAFEVPVYNADTAKISVSRDSTVLPAQIKMTTEQIKIYADTLPGNYTVTLFPECIQDMFGRKNDTIRVKYVIPEPRTQGQVVFSVKPSEGSRILQLVDEKDQVIRSTVIPPNGKGVIKTVTPGNYRLRIIEDTNGNGIWDTGNWSVGKQPEMVYFYSGTVTVRANWEIEIKWEDYN